MFVCLNNDDNNNNNKTGQVELSARQVNYYYFKIILVGGACPFIRKAGVLVRTLPDSMTSLGQRWLKVVSSVGPTLDANVGPT